MIAEATNEADAVARLEGAIVVVAKCPLPGKCKTRLVPLLGHQGAAQLAKAMLCDILKTIGTCKALCTVSKILLYAPADDEGRAHMSTILQEIGVEDSWILMPMLKTDLGSSDLSKILRDALHRARKLLESNSEGFADGVTTCQQQGGVMFLGMDAPELPIDEIMTALRTAKFDKGAFMCPAADGGYGMLCVPAGAHADLIFQNVRWSHALTAVSQIKALTDCNIVVKLGRLMHDLDEPEDVRKLCYRLSCRLPEALTDVLQKPSNKEMDQLDGHCDYTRKALIELGLLNIDSIINTS